MWRKQRITMPTTRSREPTDLGPQGTGWNNALLTKRDALRSGSRLCSGPPWPVGPSQYQGRARDCTHSSLAAAKIPCSLSSRLSALWNTCLSNTRKFTVHPEQYPKPRDILAVDLHIKERSRHRALTRQLLRRAAGHVTAIIPKWKAFQFNRRKTSGKE